MQNSNFPSLALHPRPLPPLLSHERSDSLVRSLSESLYRVVVSLWSDNKQMHIYIYMMMLYDESMATSKKTAIYYIYYSYSGVCHRHLRRAERTHTADRDMYKK